MREQVSAIVWAQFRITRNHFPRTSFGTVLSWSLTGLWYLVFVAMALLAARGLQHTPPEYLLLAVSAGLLIIFGYIQIVPLLTASGGWSLQLDKLQPFPIPSDTLFLIEVVLRLSSAPEMLILFCGGFAGLLLRHDLPVLAPLSFLLFIPFCLFLQLAIRDFLLHSFARNRFRELLTVLFMAFALLPQLLVRHHNAALVKPYLVLLANGSITPWRQIAELSIGRFSVATVAAVLGWNVLAAILARVQFMKSLRQEDSFRPAVIAHKAGRKSDIFGALTRRLPDPFGAQVEKELRTLVRMPRFRVLFGMACLFSIFVFLPVAMESGRDSFMAENAVPVTSLYGLLLLSDALLLNIFGFDRGAAQLYFSTPPELSTVIRAKNLAAVFLVAVQAMAVPLLSLLFRMHVTPFSAISALLSSAVATVFLMAAGNLLSVHFPRPIDPRSAFRKQGASKIQLWLLGCSLGMFIMVGFAFLARWATDMEWVLPAVLGLEFAIGLLIYRISLQSTIEYALASQEQIVTALSKNTAPLGA
jgi:ABC-2 type transport system permease protein